MEQIVFSVSWAQIAGSFAAIVVTIAGGVLGLLRWSIVRYIKALDARFDSLEERMDKTDERLATLYQRQETLVREATMKTECSACRKECQDRLVANQRDMIVWMQRLEDKLERIVMMVANMMNGQGGVKNGLG